MTPIQLPTAIRDRLPVDTLTATSDIETPAPVTADTAPPMRDAPDEWEQLSRAMEDTSAACDGDARFTLDRADIDADMLAALQLVCSSCPVLALCDAFAVASRPPLGVWAGVQYPRRRGRGRKKAAA